MKNALRSSLLTITFLLAFTFSAIAGDKQPHSHRLNCPVNASAGKSAKVHTTHIRKKGKPKKQHAQKSKPSKQRIAKEPKQKTEKAPKQKTAKVKKEKSRDIQQQRASNAKKQKTSRTKSVNYRSGNKGRSRAQAPSRVIF
jgi:hypothetical protein